MGLCDLDVYEVTSVTPSQHTPAEGRQTTEQGGGESNLRACREGDREEMHTDRHHGTFQKGQRVGTPRALGGEGRRAGKGCGRDGLTVRVRNGALFLSPCFLFLLGTVPCSLVGKDCALADGMCQPAGHRAPRGGLGSLGGQRPHSLSQPGLLTCPHLHSVTGVPIFSVLSGMVHN